MVVTSASLTPISFIISQQWYETTNQQVSCFLLPRTTTSNFYRLRVNSFDSDSSRGAWIEFIRYLEKCT